MPVAMNIYFWQDPGPARLVNTTSFPFDTDMEFVGKHLTTLSNSYGNLIDRNSFILLALTCPEARDLMMKAVGYGKHGIEWLREVLPGYIDVDPRLDVTAEQFSSELVGDPPPPVEGGYDNLSVYWLVLRGKKPTGV